MFDVRFCYEYFILLDQEKAFSFVYYKNFVNISGAMPKLLSLSPLLSVARTFTWLPANVPCAV
jgi:hypothetical protein